ncbi:MAG: MlaD family protein [Thermodesulfobacteriota bacterium]
MNKKTNYFKVGLFALFGVLVLVAGLITFGAGTIFKEKVTFETYFDKPISGLEAGSLFKLQGVQVGVVKEIGFVFNKYPTGREYVLVRFEVFLDKVGIRKSKGRKLTTGERLDLVERMVKNGLRVELTPQGVTGTNFLNAIYLDPKKYPPLELDWQPEYQYIPSAPGAVNIVVEAIQNVGELLELIDFANIADDLQLLLVNTNEVFDDFRKSSIGGDLEGFFEDIRSSLAEVEKLTASMNSLVESNETKAALKNMSETLENLKIVSKNLPETVAALNNTLSRLDKISYEQKEEIEETLENIKQISEDINGLTTNIKKYPSWFLFGNPPPKIN